MEYFPPVSYCAECVREALFAGAAHVAEGTYCIKTDPKSVGPAPADVLCDAATQTEPLVLSCMNWEENFTMQTPLQPPAAPFRIISRFKEIVPL